MINTSDSLASDSLISGSLISGSLISDILHWQLIRSDMSNRVLKLKIRSVTGGGGGEPIHDIFRPSVVRHVIRDILPECCPAYDTRCYACVLSGV
jgi:hypothetical protein